ncbi:MAG: signal recognition particle protein [Candidatus Electryoneaceae bacterium]|nr:signal recognition particle protein [Candidatus Electryoneaceae bacterium]
MMFEELTERFEKFVRNVRGKGKLTEANVKDTMREVRRILLQADVSLVAAKVFVKGVLDRSLGREVLASVTPGQQMVKIIHDELVTFLGADAEPIRFGKSPSSIMMVGLNGAGKTTTSAKLAVHLKRIGRRPLLVAADTRRPAAAEQLETLGKQIDVPVFVGDDRRSPVKVAKAARKHASDIGLDCLIIDSAGRMAIDEELMTELGDLYKAVKPSETLLVVDGMTGQDAVRSAKAFLERIELTGLVLTKLDGDSRGGAALSIRFVTGCPIKFVGIGEKLSDLEPFHPDRMAGRILGMGDIVTFVERAQSAMDTEQAQELAKKVQRQEFTFEDFQDQIRQIKKLGSLESLISMIPGMNKAMKGVQIDDNELFVIEAIVNSMTVQERQTPRIINGSRRKRIARGSGRTIQEVNRLLNQFVQIQKMMKRMGGKHGKKKMPFGLPGMPGLGD